MSLFIHLSTQCLTDPKFIDAGPEASWLWVKGLLYAKVHLTDGFIPLNAMPLLTVGLSKPKQAYTSLVECGLWEKSDGGVTVGSDRWSRWQTTREQVENARAAGRERQSKSRKRNSVTQNSVTDVSQRDSTTPVTRNINNQSTEYRVQRQSTEGERARGALKTPPSTEPLESAPEGLTAMQYAKGLLEKASVPSSFKIEVKTADTLEFLARDEDCALHEATDRLLDRLRTRSDPRKKSLWFWLEDGDWKLTHSQDLSTAGME